MFETTTQFSDSQMQTAKPGKPHFVCPSVGKMIGKNERKQFANLPIGLVDDG